MLLSPADVVTMYQSGATLADIVKNGAHNHRWIYWCLTEAGVREVRKDFVPKHRVIEDDPNTERIRRWRRQGATIAKIAEELGHTTEYVSRRLTEEGRRPIRKPFKKKEALGTLVSAPESMQMRELYAKGMSFDEIAKALKRNKNTVIAHVRCETIQAKMTPQKMPWPKITSNFDKALKGRKFEELRLPTIGVPSILRNMTRFG